jgi:Enoyl-CoA hydratase/isomerase
MRMSMTAHASPNRAAAEGSRRDILAGVARGALAGAAAAIGSDVAAQPTPAPLRRVGRSRALEIVLSGDDFNADIAERYGWVNRTLGDQDLDSFVDALVQRLASFDRETLAAAKAQINRFGKPTATELQSSNDMIFSILASPGAQARRAKVRNIGYGVRSDFELNFGRYLPALGRADER